MSSSINVTPVEIRKSAKIVDGEIKNYVKLYNQLYAEVGAIATTWKGEANQAYASQIEGFKVEFENLKKVLDNYVEFLNESARVYEQTENNIKDAAKKLTSGK